MIACTREERALHALSAKATSYMLAVRDRSKTSQGNEMKNYPVVHAQSPRLSRATRRSWTGFNCLDGSLRMPRFARNVTEASWFPVNLNDLGELLADIDKTACGYTYLRGES